MPHNVANRRTFSLLHEFVYLLLGQSGASDLDVDASRPPETQAVEVFCNAAAALMPRKRLLGMSPVRARGPESEVWENEELHELVNLFGVSRVALLRRLLQFGRTTQRFYNDRSRRWNKEFLEAEKRRKQAFKDSDRDFKKNPPRDVYLELGRPFVRLVLDNVQANLISMSEASSLDRSAAAEKLTQNSNGQKNGGAEDA